MKVRAIKDGFYGNQRRKAGAVFDLKEGDKFSSRWMVRVEERVADQPVAPSGKKSKQKQPELPPAASVATGDAEVI